MVCSVKDTRLLRSPNRPGIFVDLLHSSISELDRLRDHQLGSATHRIFIFHKKFNCLFSTWPWRRIRELKLFTSVVRTGHVLRRPSTWCPVDQSLAWKRNARPWARGRNYWRRRILFSRFDSLGQSATRKKIFLSSFFQSPVGFVFLFLPQNLHLFAVLSLLLPSLSPFFIIRRKPSHGFTLL